MARRRTSRRRHTESTFQRGYMSGDIHRAINKIREKGEHVLIAAKTALKEGVDLIVADAKRRCPVKTGKLRDSIKANKEEDGAAYVLTADATNDKGIAYGQFVEFDPRINRKFLYPAMDANIDYVKDKVSQAIHTAAGE